MARTKQVPSRREASSEYFNKEKAAWEDTNGKNKSNASAAPAKSEAGVVQLVIAVVGIYASLYVFSFLSSLRPLSSLRSLSLGEAVSRGWIQWAVSM